MTLRKLYLIPVWILSLGIQPFLPPSHPWRFKVLTLRWWDEGATNFAVFFGWLFWTLGFSLVGFLIVILLTSCAEVVIPAISTPILITDELKPAPKPNYSHTRFISLEEAQRQGLVTK